MWHVEESAAIILPAGVRSCGSPGTASSDHRLAVGRPVARASEELIAKVREKFAGILAKL
jgi:hypothetical protein